MAAVVLESDVKDWFEFPVALKLCLPSIHDLAISKSKTENRLPPICLIDELARVQVVSKKENCFSSTYKQL